MRKYSKVSRQLVLFLLVGLASLALDVMVTSILYNVFNLPAYAAGGIGFLSAFFINFPINRKHVFKHTKRDRFVLKIQIAFYVALVAFNLLMTGLLLETILAYSNLSVEIAKILVTALIACWNFILFKYVIFSKKSTQPNDL